MAANIRGASNFMVYGSGWSKTARFYNAGPGTPPFPMTPPTKTARPPYPGQQAKTAKPEAVRALGWLHTARF